MRQPAKDRNTFRAVQRGVGLSITAVCALALLAQTTPAQTAPKNEAPQPPVRSGTAYYPITPVAGVYTDTADKVLSGALDKRKMEQKLGAIVEEFRSTLDISERIVVSIVRSNQLLVSVRPSPLQARTFIVRLDKHFLATLSEEELRGAIAHELGHVWIFTHSPYIQTETLANSTALELVSRDNLKHVYEKVWAYEGRQGSPDKILNEAEEGLSSQTAGAGSGGIPPKSGK